MGHDGDAAEPERVDEPLQGLDVALPGARRVGLRIAVAREVRSDCAHARLTQRRQRVVPHVRRLRVAVDQQHGRPVRGTLLAVCKSGGPCDALSASYLP